MCCRVQSCAGGFRRQTTKGAALQSVHAMALKKHCQEVKQCPGLAPSPLVQSSPPDSAETNREGRCEEEWLVNNFPFSVRGLERSRVGQMLLKWEGKGLFKGEGQSAVAVPCSRSSWCQYTGRWETGRNWVLGGISTAYGGTQANFENSPM